MPNAESSTSDRTKAKSTYNLEHDLSGTDGAGFCVSIEAAGASTALSGPAFGFLFFRWFKKKHMMKMLSAKNGCGP
jgi:hypothetical protein